MLVSPSLGVRDTLADAKGSAGIALKAASGKFKATAKKASKKTISISRDLVTRLPGIAKLSIPAPPVPALLRSNSPPTDQQAALILAALQRAEAEKQRLKARLARGAESNNRDGWKAVIDYKLDLIDEFIRQHKAILSPLRLLPPDIIEEIFHWFTYPQTSSNEWRNIPWMLGHICRSWRDVALSASFLWHQIPHVILDKRSLPRRHALDELFRRSANRPLELFICSSSHNYDYPLIDVLIRHAKSWHSVNFAVPLSFFTTLRATRGRLSNLRTLAISCWPLESELTEMNEQAIILDMFKTAPLLEEVIIHGAVPKQMSFPFSQLLRYEHTMTGGLPTGHVFTYPMLECLSLLGLSGDLVVPPVTLHRLVRLHLSTHNTDISFLNNLTLPVIEELKLDSFRGNVYSAIAAMISRSASGCRLSKLCVRLRLFQQEDIISLLQLTPRLRKLDVSIPSAADISVLASGLEGKLLLPQLQTCCFHIAPNMVSAESVQALKNLASSRCEALAHPIPGSGDTIDGEIQPIKTLLLYFDSPSHLVRGLNLWDPITLQAALEEWPSSPMSAELHRARTHLHATLAVRYAAQQTRNGAKWFDRVDKLLTLVEGLDIINARDIYLSEIHLSLKRLGKLEALEGQRHNIPDRARALLRRWDVTFQESLKDRHWAFQGMNSIVYISGDDPLRDSPRAQGIIYGLPWQGQNEKLGDVFWSAD